MDPKKMSKSVFMHSRVSNKSELGAGSWNFDFGCHSDDFEIEAKLSCANSCSRSVKIYC